MILRAECERDYNFMKDLDDTVNWLSDDEYEKSKMNPKYMYTLTEVDIVDKCVKSQASRPLSAPNPLFSSRIEDQKPILFDLGTTKSLIKPIQAYIELIQLQEVITIGKLPEVNIVGIDHVGGLKDVLQPESTATPELLSFTNYLDSWPNKFWKGNHL
jgi:hypothetical protein